MKYFLRLLMFENNIVCCNFYLIKLIEESVLGIIVFKLYCCIFYVLLMLGLIRRWERVVKIFKFV